MLKIKIKLYLDKVVDATAEEKLGYILTKRTFYVLNL